MSKLSMRTRMYHSVNGRMCAGAHFLSRRNPDNVLLLGGIVITVNFGPFAKFKNSFLMAVAVPSVLQGCCSLRFSAVHRNSSFTSFMGRKGMMMSNAVSLMQ